MAKKSFVIYDGNGQEVTLDKDKNYVRTSTGQIVEVPPNTQARPDQLQLVATKGDIRLAEVTTTNVLKVDTKLQMTQTQLADRRRKVFTYTTEEIEVNEFALFPIPIGASSFVTKLEVDTVCTTEIFSDKDMLDVSPYRFISTEDHLIDDGRTLMSDMSYTISKRNFVLVNRDSPAQNGVYGKITNDSGISTPITISIEYIPIETVDVSKSLVVEVSNPSFSKDEEVFSVTGVVVTPTRFILGNSGPALKADIEETLQNTCDVIGRKRPDKNWPVDEDGGSWTDSVDMEIDGLCVNRFYWPHTPSDGTYSVYLRFEKRVTGSFRASTEVTIKIELGDTVHTFTESVASTQDDLGKVHTKLVRFTLDGGKYRIEPVVDDVDINTVASGVE